MMDIKRKIQVLIELGNYFGAALKKVNSADLTNDKLEEKALELNSKINKAQHENGWFDSDSVCKSIDAWRLTLTEVNITKWLNEYSFSNQSKSVGVIMAGNIPLVGLHDALCVLISGHELKAKLSSKDSMLMLNVFEALILIEPSFKDKILFNTPLNGVDYLIATGSDNSARYFDYYFKDVRRIIRKNRTSIAIVQESDSKENLEGLASDVFSYYGLGCRNVTKVYVPTGYDLDKMFTAFFPFQELANHNKYANNYDYNKAVYLLNKIELIENGFLLLKEDKDLHSPVGVLFYEYYDNLEELSLKVNLNKDDIQCKVSSIDSSEYIPFGKAQQPELWDYADGVDTIKFLN